jgi:hypothetical protein
LRTFGVYSLVAARIENLQSKFAEIELPKATSDDSALRVMRTIIEVSTYHGGNHMSKKAAEHHKKASEHLTRAAHHHGEAAKYHEAGNHEKAAHHAHTARSHMIHARGHSDDAVKAHGEEHGRK